jgi:hypothetical protein
MRRTAVSLAVLLCLGGPVWAADQPDKSGPPPPQPTESTPAPVAHPVPPSAPPGSLTVRLNGQISVSGGVGFR